MEDAWEPPSDMAVSAVILAGGKSRRLGEDKSFLVVDGQPLIARMAGRLTALSDDLIIVTNEPKQYEPLALPVRLVPDEQPGVGSLMGIYSGLKVADHHHALVVACDMPFLSVPLLRYMVRLIVPRPLTGDYDVIIPRLGDLLEPLHAIYSKTCLPAIAQLLAQERRQIIAFFPQVRVRYVVEDEINRFDPYHLSFVNVNTPEDWAQVQTLLAGQR
jgi:molybdopterin-guanine dinucleotide biosynthesis protein A